MAKSPKSSKARALPTTPEAPSEDVDPHLRKIAERVSQLREKRGISRNKLAEAGGVHGTHMGQFLMGRQGVSIEALGAVLITEADEARPLRIGSVAPDGRLMTDLANIVLPGFVEVPEGCGDFASGEQVHVRADASYEAGKWVVVERRADQSRHFVKCVDIDGVRFLRTPHGDEWRFQSDRYSVLAKAYGGFRPL